MNTSERKVAETEKSQKKIKVLMVDDEETYARLLKLNLEAAGAFEVQTISKAVEAVQAALDFQPDIILLDVMMPDGDGGDIAASMQEQSVLASTPIIFITAAIKRTEAAQRHGRIGGRRLLAKPVPTEEIILAITEELAV